MTTHPADPAATLATLIAYAERPGRIAPRVDEAWDGPIPEVEWRTDAEEARMDATVRRNQVTA